MTYRERLTVAVQKMLYHHGLTETQIAQVYVDSVDVSPTTPDSYLAVDCTVPSTMAGETSLRTRVLLDERTTLRILLNGLLDVTNVARPPRRTPREITDEINQAVYAKLGQHTPREPIEKTEETL